MPEVNGGSMYVAIVVLDAIRSTPRFNPRISRSSCSAIHSTPNSSLARAYSVCPASVSFIDRALRSISDRFSCRSNSFRDLEIAGWLRRSDAAALVNPPWLTTAAKSLRWWRFIVITHSYRYMKRMYWLHDACTT
jgi:hypothetical protein